MDLLNLLVGPAAALLGVWITQYWQHRAMRERAREAAEQERHRLQLRLLESEVAPILEFVDEAVRSVRDFGLQLNRRSIRIQYKLEVEDSMVFFDEVNRILGETVKLGSLALVRAGALGEELKQVVFNFMAALDEAKTTYNDRYGFEMGLPGAKEVSLEVVNTKMYALYDAGSEVRKGIRNWTMSMRAEK